MMSPISEFRKKIHKANTVARKLVRIEKIDHRHWAVTIDGWHIHGYDSFWRKADAVRGRKIVVQHFDVALYRAGVK